MEILDKIKLNKKYILILFTFLILFFVISGYLEYRSRRTNVIKLMQQNSRNLSRTIKQASINSLLSYNYLNSQSREQMLTTLTFIDCRDSTSKLTRKFFANIKKSTNIRKVQILDSNGKLIFSSRDEMQVKQEKKIQSFLNNNQNFKLISGSRDNYMVQALLRRSQGGVIIGTFNVENLVKFNKKRGIGDFLNNAVKDSSVLYVAIQNKQGILAASQRVDSLSSINYDSFLQNVLEKKQFQYRYKSWKGQKVYESVLPFSLLDNYKGLIRIGLDFSPIQRVQKSALWNVLIRVVILTILGFLVLGYTMSRNTVETLRKEKERITEEVYELQKSLREKEKQNAIHHLASGVAHEIGNPLNALSLTVQRLQRKISSKNDDVHEMMSLIRNEVDRIDKIIQKFLNFSKPVPLEKQETNLNELIEEILNLYQNKLQENNIELKYNSKSDCTLKIDKEKIKQSLINLLENAIEALEDTDNKRIEIELNRKDETVELRISDNGSGMDEETRSKIFNLYFSTKENGTGIGLAKVYKIIHNHNGEISVDSTPGEGTTFYIKLPHKQ